MIRLLFFRANEAVSHPSNGPSSLMTIRTKNRASAFCRASEHFLRFFSVHWRTINYRRRTNGTIIESDWEDAGKKLRRISTVITEDCIVMKRDDLDRHNRRTLPIPRTFRHLFLILSLIEKRTDREFFSLEETARVVR